MSARGDGDGFSYHSSASLSGGEVTPPLDLLHETIGPWLVLGKNTTILPGPRGSRGEKYPGLARTVAASTPGALAPDRNQAPLGEPQARVPPPAQPGRTMRRCPAPL